MSGIHNKKSYLFQDIVLVVSTAIFVFGGWYIYQKYISNTKISATTQDVALVHCGELYTEYAAFVIALEQDPDCSISGVWSAVDDQFLDITESERAQMSTAFNKDGSLSLYDPAVVTREWDIIVSILEDDPDTWLALAKDAIAYLNNKFGDNIVDINFLMRNRIDLLQDFHVQYQTAVGVDIYAFATYLDANPDFKDANGESLVVVSPNFERWHKVISTPDEDSVFGTQSVEDGPLDQRYLDYLWYDELLACLPEGTPITIWVVDNGFDLTHPDLQEVIVDSFDEANQDKDAQVPKIEKAWNHGTKEAGIIWAQHNDFGVRGIVPDANLVVIKSTKDTAPGTSVTDGIMAIATAYDLWAQVINLSRGWYGQVPLLERITKKIAKDGGVIVAAAGNYNKSEEFYPAAYERVIWVAATDQQDNKAVFSNYGDRVDVAAPGVDMLTTDLDNTYKKYSGTSEATPVVASAIALALSHWFGRDDIVTNLKPSDRDDIWSGIIDLSWMCPALELQSIDWPDTQQSLPTEHASADDQSMWSNTSSIYKKLLGALLILVALWLWIRDIVYYRKS